MGWSLTKFRLFGLRRLNSALSPYARSAPIAKAICEAPRAAGLLDAKMTSDGMGHTSV
jgi:hypothetical protein